MMPLAPHGTKTKDFKKLVENGGHVHTFITSQRALLRFRLNYHDHRKSLWLMARSATQVVSTLPINMSTTPKKKFGYWRDTHIRIYGAAASLLRFAF